MLQENIVRNLGIDIARIYSMYCVILLHVVNLGELQQCGGVYADLALIYEVLSIGCVDFFAMISGFVGLSSRWKPKSWLKLWFQVFSTGIVLFLCSRLFTKSMMPASAAFFPLLTNEYWYFTAYTGLFVFIPLINSGLNSLSLGLSKRLVFGVFALMFLLWFSKFDLWELRKGYSVIWLMICYILGACLRNESFRVTKAVSVWGAVICYALTFVLSATLRYFGLDDFKQSVVSYTSPLVVAASMFLLNAFSFLSSENKHIVRIVNVISPLVFGIYLIHVSPFVFSGVFLKTVRWFVGSFGGHLFIMMISIPLFCLCLFFLFGFAEFVRQNLIGAILRKLR